MRSLVESRSSSFLSLYFLITFLFFLFDIFEFCEPTSFNSPSSLRIRSISAFIFLFHFGSCLFRTGLGFGPTFSEMTAATVYIMVFTSVMVVSSDNSYNNSSIILLLNLRSLLVFLFMFNLGRALRFSTGSWAYSRNFSQISAFRHRYSSTSSSLMMLRSSILLFAILSVSSGKLLCLFVITVFFSCSEISSALCISCSTTMPSCKL